MPFGDVLLAALTLSTLPPRLLQCVNQGRLA